MSDHHDAPVSEVGRLDVGVRTLMHDLRFRGGVRLDLVGRVLVGRRALHHLRRVDEDDGGKRSHGEEEHALQGDRQSHDVRMEYVEVSGAARLLEATSGERLAGLDPWNAPGLLYSARDDVPDSLPRLAEHERAPEWAVTMPEEEGLAADAQG